ncbi:hypothetical protein ABK040_001856 [Willaertia magna]
MESNQFVPLELPKQNVVTGAERQSKPITHPVENVLRRFEKDELKRQYFMMSKVFGSHMPMHMEMQKRIFGAPLRLSNFQSSRIGLDILTGRDESIEFEDYLCDPNMSERIPEDVHSTMEKNLGLKVDLHKV